MKYEYYRSAIDDKNFVKGSERVVPEILDLVSYKRKRVRSTWNKQPITYYVANLVGLDRMLYGECPEVYVYIGENAGKTLQKIEALLSIYEEFGVLKALRNYQFISHTIGYSSDSAGKYNSLRNIYKRFESQHHHLCEYDKEEFLLKSSSNNKKTNENEIRKHVDRLIKHADGLIDELCFLRIDLSKLRKKKIEKKVREESLLSALGLPPIVQKAIMFGGVLVVKTAARAIGSNIDVNCDFDFDIVDSGADIPDFDFDNDTQNSFADSYSSTPHFENNDVDEVNDDYSSSDSYDDSDAYGSTDSSDDSDNYSTRSYDDSNNYTTESYDDDVEIDDDNDYYYSSFENYRDVDDEYEKRMEFSETPHKTTLYSLSGQPIGVEIKNIMGENDFYEITTQYGDRMLVSRSDDRVNIDGVTFRLPDWDQGEFDYDPDGRNGNEANKAGDLSFRANDNDSKHYSKTNKDVYIRTEEGKPKGFFDVYLSGGIKYIKFNGEYIPIDGEDSFSRNGNRYVIIR